MDRSKRGSVVATVAAALAATSVLVAAVTVSAMLPFVVQGDEAGHVDGVHPSPDAAPDVAAERVDVAAATAA